MRSVAITGVSGALGRRVVASLAERGGWSVVGIDRGPFPAAVAKPRHFTVHLLDLATPTPEATAIRFRSFDGVYTENMTLEQARDDVLVALTMYGEPVTHDHGGPVRAYAAPMYGYKSTKWLSEIELTDRNIPGYWEERGYPLDGIIGG